MMSIFLIGCIVAVGVIVVADAVMELLERLYWRSLKHVYEKEKLFDWIVDRWPTVVVHDVKTSEIWHSDAVKVATETIDKSEGETDNKDGSQ